MADASASRSPASGQRTFDCPWCGAISSIPASHLGEHFPCPECKKATKLTPKNTTSLPPTAAPPGAPHLSGDRTFDCPWCGAISSIPSSHLGEHHVCPECQKRTKLTEKNTTRRKPSEAPPGAPHVEPAKPAPARTGLVVALLVGLLGVGAWVAFGMRGDGGDHEGPEREGTPTPVASGGDPAARPPRTGEPRAPEPSASTPGAAPAAGTEGTPAAPAPPADPATAERVRARERLARAEKALSEAEARLAAARAPAGGADVARLRADVAAAKDVQRQIASLAEGANPAAADAARGRNLALLQYLQDASARTRVAEAALERLREDPAVREVVGVSWTELDFQGFAFRRALGELVSAWESAAGAAAPAPGADAEAVRAVEAARREDSEARAALEALGG
jgi:hypothetical protein